MGELVAQALGDVAEGSRNERGVWLACQLRDAGMAQAQAEGTMQEYAGRVPNPNPPTYTADDALATVRSVYATPARAPAFRSGTWHNHLPAWIHALNLRPFAHRLLQAVANMCNAQPIDGYGSLGFCYAKAETLAKAAGMSERTLQRRMPKMLGNGLVVLISRGGKDKGMRCAHVYAIPGVRGVLNHVRYKGNAARRIDRVTVGHRTIPVGDGGASGNASPCPTSSPSGADRMTDCHPAKELAYSGGADCHPLPRNVL